MTGAERWSCRGARAVKGLVPVPVGVHVRAWDAAGRTSMYLPVEIKVEFDSVAAPGILC